MNVDKVFLSVNAHDFAAQSKWWATLLGRQWDREPMPACHEWDVAGCVAFQVLDNPDGDRTAVTLHVDDVDAERERLRQADIEIGEPGKVDGFNTLRFVEFADPEGNSVGLLDGA